MTLLISGASGGLGRFLQERVGGVSLTRQQPLETISMPDQPYDAIIHCAFNMGANKNSDAMTGYLEDTVFLTRRLTELPHKLFIFISTIDVYPSSDVLHKEDEEIDPNTLSGLYPVFKLACESIVKNNCEQFLILRPGLLLGRYMRQNNLTRVALGHPGKVTLSRKSSFNCVLYEDVLDVIQKSLTDNLSGIYNLVRSGQVVLGALADKVSPETQFGSYTYITQRISNKKISKISPAFMDSSLEAVESLLAWNK